MIKKTLKKPYIVIPDCWDELFSDEWTRLLVLFDAMVHIEMFTYEDLRRLMAQYMLTKRGLGVNIFMRNDSYYLLVDKIAEGLDWMITRDESGLVLIKLDTTRQLMPYVGELIGPKSHAEDLTFGEFQCAVAAMNRYNESQDDNDLKALTAVLYRPKGKDGKRVPFHVEEMGILMDKADGVPWHLRFGIYAWFSYLCYYIRTGWFDIKGSSVCFAPLFRQAEENDERPEEVNELGLNGILLSVAQSGVFGDVDKVNQTPVLKVFMKLLSDYHEAERIKRMSKQHGL